MPITARRHSAARHGWTASLGITDFGHRGTPNIFLNATLVERGPWNAAHFNNPDYDGWLTSYRKARDLQAQRAAAGKIQTLLLDETPLIFSYFPDLAGAGAPDVSGLPPIAAGLLLDRVSLG